VRRELFNNDGMSSSRIHQPATATAAARAQQLYGVIGALIRGERIRRGWGLRDLSGRAQLSVAMVQAIESGAAGSVDAYVRLATALGLRLDLGLSDPTARPGERSRRMVDPVHSAMGEFEAAHLRPFGFQLGMDEPYQHFQFAGRADIAAWDVSRRALLHLENRTRTPDFQDAAGSHNAKRAYLAEAIGARGGVAHWASETHVVVALWSAEMLHAIRLRPESFRSICPDAADGFAAWWRGEPPTNGRTSTLIVLDPAATSGQRGFIDLEAALTARPRYAGYADAVAGLAEPR
jgi:transcriptional regulator with XRE-family HTH domain